MTGTGTLTVILRHLPPENDVAVKVEGLAEQVAADGIDSIGDAQAPGGLVRGDLISGRLVPMRKTYQLDLRGPKRNNCWCHLA